MKTTTLLVYSLATLGLGSVHAANVAITDGTNITTTFDIAAADRLLQNGETNVTVSSGGTININSSTSGSFIGQLNSSKITIDGGAFNHNGPVTLILGNGTGASNVGEISLLDGSFNTSAGSTFILGRDAATGVLSISGGTANIAGGLVFDNHDPDIGQGSIDFTLGSTGSLTVAGADLAFYQGLYSGDDLTYNGVNTATFGDVFTVSGETISVVPEPSSTALLGLGGLALILRRRK